MFPIKNKAPWNLFEKILQKCGIESDLNIEKLKKIC